MVPLTQIAPEGAIYETATGSSLLEVASFLSVAQPDHATVTALLQRYWGALTGTATPGATPPNFLMVLPVVLAFSFLVLIMFSFWTPWASRDKENKEGEETDPLLESTSGSENEDVLKPWSTKAIIALTSYRFYTGFLNATWMPYLLAMEGHELMADRQSLFMGSAKLIYGLSILLNPLFGLVGDQTASSSRWAGRRLFILLGVAISGLGIYGCLIAEHINSTAWYLTATVLWMLGEAMADVTTETLVPELLPRSQYELSSSIRAMNFLIGGLAGYVMLICFRHYHFTWLYYAYLLCMIFCAGLSLVFISGGDTRRAARPHRQADSWPVMLSKAYVLPTRLVGGFPRACFCLFLFSLGSAPMFFLLLLVRDVVGVKNRPDLQMHFSIISIIFFISAAVAASSGAIASYFGAKQSDPTSGSSGDAAESQTPRTPRNTTRWPLMIASCIGFSVVCAIIPVSGVFGDLTTRLAVFYVIAAFFGLAFGSVYARFQDCTWSLLPTNGDIANLMGFAAMSKLAGVGIGNFIVGIILDNYSSGTNAYEFRGYVIMCMFCCVVSGLAAALAYTVGKTATKLEDEKGSTWVNDVNPGSSSSRQAYGGGM